MIDVNTLPYVDLGCSVESLRQYALDNFGKKIPPNAKPETVVERFAQIYLEETGVTLAPVVNPPDNPDDGDENPPEEAKKANPKFATIIVQDDEKDPGAICGSVNFVAYRIQRNVETKVPFHILESLRNAKKTIYDPATMAPKEVLAYPFSIVGYSEE